MNLRPRLRAVHAMAAAWDTSVSNLFDNQFNVGCDLAAAQALLTSESPEQLACPTGVRRVVPGGDGR